jgi:hypothetical protein
MLVTLYATLSHQSALAALDWPAAGSRSTTLTTRNSTRPHRELLVGRFVGLPHQWQIPQHELLVSTSRNPGVSFETLSR